MFISYNFTMLIYKLCKFQGGYRFYISTLAFHWKTPLSVKNYYFSNFWFLFLNYYLLLPNCKNTNQNHNGMDSEKK